MKIRGPYLKWNRNYNQILVKMNEKHCNTSFRTEEESKRFFSKQGETYEW